MTWPKRGTRPTMDIVDAYLRAIADKGGPPPKVRKIRDDLPHLNKNQIAGALDRLRKSGCPYTPPVDAGMRLNTPENRARAAQRQPLEPLKRPGIATAKKRARTRRIAFSVFSKQASVGPGRCQYIAGDPLPDDSCKCGDVTMDGSSYCVRHHRLCWRTIEQFKEWKDKGETSDA